MTPLRLSVHPARFLLASSPAVVSLVSLPCLLLLTGILDGASLDLWQSTTPIPVGALAEALNVLTLQFHVLGGTVPRSP